MNGRPEIKSKLKTSFSIFFGFQLILLVVLAILIVLLFQNQQKLAASRDTHFNSYLLADELRQSSDDLTRLARAYVATGNPEFEKEYWTVLDIRNGKIPRPTSYNRIYWDFVSATGKKPRADGEKISLQNLMIKEGFTQAEFDLLALAQQNSDGLVTAERVAMNAMKGIFDDGTGSFSNKGAPDPALANELMNNAEYYKTKAEIMRPIYEFYEMFETRTTGAIAEYLNNAQFYFWITILLALFITASSTFSFLFVRRQINKRETAEKNLSDLNKSLEQKIKERTETLTKAEEKLKKTLKNENKFNQLMVGRELKMIELKKELNELTAANKPQPPTINSKKTT